MVKALKANTFTSGALKFIAISAALMSLSACVTQNYENSNTPVVQNDSTNTEIAMTRISLGLGYLKMGNTTQAKLNLEKAKRFSPELVQVYTAFAHYYETVGEDDLTIASYEKALSLKPDDADTLNNYGVFLCRKDKLSEAETQFLKAIAVPSYLLVSQSYENLALCQLKAPNFDKAQTYLAKAIDHNPSSAPTLYQMMRLQYAKGQYTEALAYSKRFEKATRRFNPESLALSYKIYRKLGNQRIAKNYGAMLVKMFPESWQAKQYLLNELEQIDADELAQKYQLLKLGAISSKANKKVVVLSPTNKPAFLLKNDKKTDKKAVNTAHNNSQKTPKKTKTLKVTDARPISLAADNLADGNLAAKPKAKKTVVLKASKPKPKKVLTMPASTPATNSLPANQTQIVQSTLSTEETAQTSQGLNNDFSSDFSSDLSDETVLATTPVELNANSPVINNSGEQVVLESAENLTTEPEATDTLTDELLAVDELGDELTDPLVDDEFANLAEGEQVYQSFDDLPFHEVAQGENLFTISKKYNIHLRSLRKWNSLDERALLRIGDTVYLADPANVQTEIDNEINAEQALPNDENLEQEQ